MEKGLTIKRTDSADPDFQLLVSRLDHELWNELHEDQATYDQFNKVPDLTTVLVLYINGRPVASGCFKQYDDDTVEIKRMFVEKEFRGRGLSSIILGALEEWAVQSGFSQAILETSVHFKVARGLYTNAGYRVIDNYDQYAGLEESVCMKKRLSSPPSEFSNLPGIEYFLFEEDFVEKSIRCIPMIVRFKMDMVAIKLKLAEWSKFSVEERIELAKRPCGNGDEERSYNDYLAGLIRKYTGNEPTVLDIDKSPVWANTAEVPAMLNEKVKLFDWKVSAGQWKELTSLQRFALLKLCKGGHENKNFVKAMREFGLVDG